MARKKRRLTTKRLAECLRYNKNTGDLTWITGGHRFGTKAGTFDDRGYIRIKIDGRQYKASRLAYILGWIGKKKLSDNRAIDHINGVRHDNRLMNLRQTRNFHNNRNRSLFSNNRHGICGIWFDERVQLYKATINGVNKKYLGSFSCLFDAACARKKAEILNGYHENHGRNSYKKHFNITKQSI